MLIVPQLVLMVLMVALLDKPGRKALPRTTAILTQQLSAVRQQPLKAAHLELVLPHNHQATVKQTHLVIKHQFALYGKNAS